MFILELFTMQLFFTDKSMWGLQNPNKAVTDAYDGFAGVIRFPQQNDFQIRSAALKLMAARRPAQRETRDNGTAPRWFQASRCSLLNLRHPAPTSNSPGQVFTVTAILVRDERSTGLRVMM